jgi:hypothetical protein
VRFSWVVVLLGVGGVAMFLASEWATAAPLGETGRPHHHLRWYAGLPLLAWVGILVLAAQVDPGS